jgi:hypothetical protein
MKFGDAQTGQLDLSNSRGDLALGILDTCSATNASLAKKLSKHWWNFF